ncbi:flagellar basal body-associated protein FliL [Bacillus fonticola]|uniref:flagellar basal body-associated protein FliL n=1 Tax=Bacillus fonticola TaxID=2728853 RepID=UPI001472ED61|nr:flagellar basal body-associated protein FliL [Bacillus fonticola]
MNKVLLTTLVTLSILTVVGAGVFAYFFLTDSQAASSEPTIDEVLEASVDFEEMTTNLMSDEFIRISFKIQTSSADAKEELDKRSFQAKNIILKKISDLSAEDFKGSEGKAAVENTLREKLNAVMQSGRVERVYITSFVLQ